MHQSNHVHSYGHDPVWAVDQQEKLVKNLWQEQRQAQGALVKDLCQFLQGSHTAAGGGAEAQSLNSVTKAVCHPLVKAPESGQKVHSGEDSAGTSLSGHSPQWSRPG